MAQQILQILKIKKAVLSIVFVSSQKIRALNKKFLNRTYATDVLAFDLSGNGSPQKKSLKSPPKELIGDIIISTDAIKQNSKKFDTSHSRELVLYVIHGILHLYGYDDHQKKDIELMRKKEEDVLKKIGSLSDKTVR